MPTKAKITESLIDKCRIRFEDGERDAVLDAIDLCARAGLALPAWLVEAYCAAYTRWATYEREARSLDQAFGVERKGQKLSQLRKRESMKAIVVIEVDKLRRQGVATDEALFEQVGEKLGIPPGTTKSFYYEDNIWRHFNADLPKMPLPNWLKSAVIAEVDKLRQEKEKVADELLFAEVGEKVNLTAEQVRNLVRSKTDDDQAPS